MKSFFLHPTVNKIFYVVGLITVAVWLLGLAGKGIYYSAYHGGLIPEKYQHHKWDDHHDGDKWHKQYRRMNRACEKFMEESAEDQEATITEEITE